MSIRHIVTGWAVMCFAVHGVLHADVASGEFTYKGQLKLDGVPVNDTCDFTFSLWRDDTSVDPGAQIGGTLNFDGLDGSPGPIEVVNGLFAAILDFGPEAFNEDPRWLETSVRCPAGEGDYSVLLPRERITGVPYAVRARGIAVDDRGNVGIGSDLSEADLHVAGNIIVSAERIDPYIELSSRGELTTMNLQTINEGFAIADRRFVPRVVVTPPGEVGIGVTRPEAPMHMFGRGEFRGNHIAFFQSRSGPESDGIAIQLDVAHTNRENNFITFYNGNRIVTGRIEGFDLENGDWVVPPPVPRISLRIDPGITYNPDWFDRGTLPSANFDPGELPTANFDRGAFPTVDFLPGRLPSLTFDGGSLPSLSFNPGTLADLDFTPGTLPSLSFSPGTLPSLTINFFSGTYNFSTGTLPSATLSTGTLPSATFNDGNLPTANFSPGSLPTATLNQGQLPALSVTGGRPPSLTFSGGELPSLSFSRGTLPRVRKPPVIFDEPSLDFDLPTAQELQDLYCWAVETGRTEFLTLDPVSLAAAHLKEKVGGRCLDEGVTYGSKGADYAEWLPKLNPEDRFQIGQIVGVRGGKVTLKTEGAEQIMAISRAPVVVGNVPAEGDKHKHVTVGFMGQLPVVVRGKVEPGDYIVPSGYEDGTAVAVPPENIELEHLGKILGRAWSESENDIYSLIDVAIGLDHNAEMIVLRKQQERIDAQARRQDALTLENARLRDQLAAMNVQMAELLASVHALEDRIESSTGCRQTPALANADR